MNLPERAEVVVIGGGVIGTSVAYHLTRMGKQDVLLLEQGHLSGGTTWHAAGLVGQLRASESGTRLVQYSTQLYDELEAETGLATGYKRCGGLTVARSEDRMVQLRRTRASAEAFDLECELLTPDEAGARYPLIRTDDLVGAIWLPGDGKANPTDLTQALAKGARQQGARIVEGARVTGIRVVGGRVVGVETGAGLVEADVVVNCAGQWAKQVGEMAGTTVPLHSAEHFYVVTEPIDGVHPDLPVLRDPDGYTYFKEEVGGLVVGGFEPEAKPWVSPDKIPYPFEFQLLEENWEHFSVLMDSALHRIPVLEETGIRKFYNGPESFTPDNQFLLGETPEVRGLFIGAGFNSVGIASAGGAGRALAEWIVSGEAQTDLTGVDVRRFARFNANNRWLRDRVGEVLGLHYSVPWPNREMQTARPFRRSPLHHLHEQDGALFGSKMGWERPNVFAPSGSSLEYSWTAPPWLPWTVAEQEATRQRVAIFDQTSFSKLLVTGPHAERALQWVCTADVAVEPGSTVYTGLLNSRGTYESDVTVTRLDERSYLLLSSAATTERDKDLLRRTFPADAYAEVVDVTSAYSVLGVMGPASRDLLSSLSDADLSDEAFPFATSREITLGYGTVRATRMTYVGELGWELLVPADLTVGVYEDLLRAGSDHGLARAGYYAIEALRLEKGYRAFGRELTPDVDPVVAGLRFTCKKEGDHLGRSAVESVVAGGPSSRRIVSFVVEHPTALAWGGELLLHDGRGTGLVTSAAYGATVGGSVGLALATRRDGPVTKDWLADGGFEIDISGDRHPVRVTLGAPLPR